MSNTITLTNLAPEIYKAADIVAREVVGAIPGAMLNTADADGVNRASKGDKIKSLRVAQTTPSSSFTPSMQISDATDKSGVFDEFALTETAKDDLPLIGETTRRLNQAGRNAETYRVNTIAQIMRSIINQMEAYLCGLIYKGGSRATGTAGTAPFASNLDILADVRQILVDNGTPMSDGQLSFVMNTLAGANFRKLTQLQKVNEAGTADLLRNGSLMNIMGMFLRESAGITLHAKGAGAGYDVDLTAGYDIGGTTIHLDGGTVNTTGIKAGDVITFAGDTNKYIVNTGTTAIEADIILNRPGLRLALADTVEATIGNSYTPNIAFHRQAVEFAARAADMGDDAAVETLLVQDPVTNIPFEFRRYAGEGMSKIMCVVYYGGKVWKPEFTAIGLG